jgi:transposase InsO family protein
MDVFTRRIIGFGIDGRSVCRMFNQAIACCAPPARISTDHDPLFRFHRWLANLRILEVKEIKSVPYAPTSHPFTERLIGTIRGEYLDHTFFCLLQRRSRPPLPQRHHAGESCRMFLIIESELVHHAWKRHCNGLFETPVVA